MVAPIPDLDARMTEAQAGITLDQVVEFIQNMPPEFIDYLMSLLAQEESANAPAPSPNLDAALSAVTPATR